MMSTELLQRKTQLAQAAARKAQAVLVTARTAAHRTRTEADEMQLAFDRANARALGQQMWVGRCPVLEELGLLDAAIFVCLTYPLGGGNNKKKRYTTPYYKFKHCTDLCAAFHSVLDQAQAQAGTGPSTGPSPTNRALGQADYEGMRILYQDKDCWTCWTVCDRTTSTDDMVCVPMFQLELQWPITN